MTRATLLVAFVAFVALVGCGGKKEDGKGTGSASATGTGTASATGAGSGTDSGTGPAAGSGAPSGGGGATCAAACEHRKQCGVAGDVATCVADCDGLSELLGASAPKELAAYIAADCAAVSQGEAGFVQATACVRACKHVRECGVVGTQQACFVECGTNLQQQRYAVADLDKIVAADCETVKKTVTITPPGSAVGGGGTSEAEALFKRNPRFPMCNDHSDCGGAYPVCCRQQFHSSCVSACY